MFNFANALVHPYHSDMDVKGNQVQILNRPRCCKLFSVINQYTDIITGKVFKQNSIPLLTVNSQQLTVSKTVEAVKLITDN